MKVDRWAQFVNFIAGRHSYKIMGLERRVIHYFLEARALSTTVSFLLVANNGDLNQRVFPSIIRALRL
jgi:hypothetical protein